MKTFSAFLLFFAWIVLSNPLQAQINLTGTWLVEVETDMGNGNPTFVLKQSGEEITGTYSGNFGESPVKGTLIKNVFHLEFEVAGNLMIYDGTASQNEIKGKVNLANLAKGTFVGKRKE